MKLELDNGSIVLSENEERRVDILITRLIIQLLDQYNVEYAKTPPGFKNHQEWVKEVDKIQQGLIGYPNGDIEKTLALFGKHFRSFNS